LRARAKCDTSQTIERAIKLAFFPDVAMTRLWLKWKEAKGGQKKKSHRGRRTLLGVLGCAFLTAAAVLAACLHDIEALLAGFIRAQVALEPDSLMLHLWSQPPVLPR